MNYTIFIKKIAKLRIDIEMQKLENKIVDADVIRENLQTFGDMFDSLEPQEQKELIQLLIKQVIYDENKSKIRITRRQFTDLGLSVKDKTLYFDESIIPLLG